MLSGITAADANEADVRGDRNTIAEWARQFTCILPLDTVSSKNINRIMPDLFAVFPELRAGKISSSRHKKITRARAGKYSTETHNVR